ncbi:MAG: terminase small subunit [Armatimonadota bacterium]
MTDRQAVFVEHYLRTWNAAKAARLAGYSTASAKVIANRLLKRSDVRELVDARLAEVRAETNRIFEERARTERIPKRDPVIIREVDR